MTKAKCADDFAAVTAIAAIAAVTALQDKQSFFKTPVIQSISNNMQFAKKLANVAAFYNVALMLLHCNNFMIL